MCVMGALGHVGDVRSVQQVESRARRNKRLRDANAKVFAETGIEFPPIPIRTLHLRDGGVCWLCGQQVSLKRSWVASPGRPAHPWSASRDHVVPVVEGGSDHWDNIRLAHLVCNQERAAAQAVA